jgi:hypothetical protein
MEQKKIKAALLTSIVLSMFACTNTVPNDTTNETQVSAQDNFKDLDKEYSFSTKALTKAYLKRKLETWLADLTKANLLVREIAYARFKHPDLFCTIMSENPLMKSDINNVIAVQTRGSIDTPFKTFVEEGCIPKWIVSTFAGTGEPGGQDGNASTATFNRPYAITRDLAGNIYVAEYYSNKIKKIDNTSNHVVTTIAGSLDGTAGSANGNGTSATFSSPAGITVDIAGNIYVSERGNNKIRMIDKDPPHVVTNIAGGGSDIQGSGNSVQFIGLQGITADSNNDGNLYVTDWDGSRISKVANDTFHTVTTIAGTGAEGSHDDNGSAATFKGPFGIAVDFAGNVYVAEYYNNSLRKIANDASHTVTTIAGGTTANFLNPYAITIDNKGNIYMADTGNNRIKLIANDINHTVTTIAGSNPGFLDNSGTNANFSIPIGITIDNLTGNLYVADFSNHRIRKITR